MHQCTITDKKSIVIFSCSMTLLDYWRSFLKKLTIVNHLWEIETNAKVAYTEHYRGRGGGCSRNPRFSSVDFKVLCHSGVAVTRNVSP